VLSELLTTKEVAGYLKLRPETVLRGVKKGEIPAIKVGGHFRFDKRQIDDWLQNNSTSKKRILVIDDDEPVRKLFKDTLEKNNYHVLTVENGSRALKLVHSWNFDLIFLDLKMPVMDGVEIFRRIRRIDRAVPVVIITGYTSSDMLRKALKQAPFGVMKKPFGSKDILRSAENFLNGAKGKSRKSVNRP
jgi:two-component system response regulator (stage 0 sporulation protein F)